MPKRTASSSASKSTQGASSSSSSSATPRNPSAAQPAPLSSLPITTPSTSAVPHTPSPASKKTPATSKSASSLWGSENPRQILENLWEKYLEKTPQRVKLLDAFLGFLVVVAVVQFAYCVLAGNYPFNAFLSGFSATVGQFVLTASLRIQTNPENTKEFSGMSHERAFADYVVGSLALHFLCVNFIN